MNLVVANWKMNPPSAEEARQIASRIERGLLGVGREKVQTVICPPQVFLPAIRHSLHFAALGAQNVSGAPADTGAFTGEVSAAMLKSLGVSYAIIGHSERRAMGGNDERINSKIRNSLERKITPILCVGFGAKKGAAAASVKRIVKAQITRGLKGITGGKGGRGEGLVVAYEPVWAIGTGKPATPQHAAEILEFARTLLPKARLLYGGSMDGTNAAAFAATGIVQGGLIGGASLKPEVFLNIIKAFS